MRTSTKVLLPVGMMLFSSFFGAGNLIFPPVMGQGAGTNLLPALLGFLITGVGMPLLGITAVALIGRDNPEALGEQVHPLYGRVITILVALTMGPFFAVPRTGAVSFDMGLRNFLPQDQQFTGMIIYSAVFFILTYLLSVKPGKVVDWVGKVLTPMLLLTLAILIICGITKPMGVMQAPVVGYAHSAFFKGFQDGYQTMDLLAALLFGGMVVDAIRGLKVISEEALPKVCIQAGFIAGAFLAVIYIALAYMGATSVAKLGQSPNGGIALAAMAHFYLGQLGSTILGLIVFFACLTTSIGVTASCASYFVKACADKIQYDRFVLGICLFAFCVANLGLTKIIAFSIPVLCALYPIVIVLVLMAFIGPNFSHGKKMYQWSLGITSIFGLEAGFTAAGITPAGLISLLNQLLPFYKEGFGWAIPALAGMLVGKALEKEYK